MDTLYLLFPVFLARSDSKVNEKAERTLRDGYTKSACINLHEVLNKISCKINKDIKFCIMQERVYSRLLYSAQT